MTGSEAARRIPPDRPVLRGRDRHGQWCAASRPRLRQMPAVPRGALLCQTSSSGERAGGGAGQKCRSQPSASHSWRRRTSPSPRPRCSALSPSGMASRWWGRRPGPAHRTSCLPGAGRARTAPSWWQCARLSHGEGRSRSGRAKRIQRQSSALPQLGQERAVTGPHPRRRLARTPSGRTALPAPSRRSRTRGAGHRRTKPNLPPRVPRRAGPP